MIRLSLFGEELLSIARREARSRRGGHTRSLLSHRAGFPALAVSLLGLTMVPLALERRLVLGLVVAVLLDAGLDSTSVRAVALSAETTVAHAEDRPAPATHASNQLDRLGLSRHRRRRGGWTSGGGRGTLGSLAEGLGSRAAAQPRPRLLTRPGSSTATPPRLWIASPRAPLRAFGAESVGIHP